jgi:glycosyltransferase involved in cell wall biosynthesis
MTGATAPILSVTVTNYNYARYLPRNIESILGQTFSDFELLVIDNASRDESLDVVRGYAERDPRIRVVAHERNEGALASLRESCDLSRGRYRVQVDADDWVIADDAFETQVEMLEANPRMAFVYSSMTMFGVEGEKLQVSHPHEGTVTLPGEEALEAILGFNLTHSGLMVRLDAYHAAGGYPDGLPHVDDMLLAARMCEWGDVGYVDRELYAFRQHGANVHLAPQERVVEREILPVIDAAFSGPLGERVPAAVRRRVTRNALLHLPTQYIFRGERRAGWKLFWQSFRLRPIDTLFQRRTLSLVLRSVVGGQVFQRLTRWRGGQGTGRRQAA